MADRILETSEIPQCLWDPSVDLGSNKPKGVLSLPERLSEAYCETLEELGLMQQAQDLENRDDGCVGGAGEDESRDHFAWNYSGSCGRVQLFCLDPRQTFKTTREAMVSLFSGGYVTILDIPSGAGSGTATLFSIIAQLRAEGVLPKIDLEVKVVGGDISATSRNIADRLFAKMHQRWIEHGILVDHRFVHWDESTGDLLEAWSETFDGRPGLLLGNNFSGFLGSAVETGKPRRWIEEAEGPLRQIFTAVARRAFSILWVEPSGKQASERMFPKLDTMLARYSRIVRVFENYPNSSAELRDPVVTDGHFAVRATGTHFEPPA